MCYKIHKYISFERFASSADVLILLDTDRSAVKDLLFSNTNVLLQDSVSLTRAMVSQDAVIVRQHVSRILADVIYRWMFETLGRGKASAAVSDHHHFNEVERQEDAAFLLQNALRDRRLRVIFYKMVKDVRKQPVLMLRACWFCFSILAIAWALAMHRTVVYLSETFLTSVAFLPKRVAVSV